MRSRASIVLFLQQMKSIVAKRGFILVNREESRRFLADENMTQGQLKAIILSLEPGQCFDGPEADRDPRYPGWTVAEFSPNHDGKTLYLKMSIKVAADTCKCLSVKLYRERGEL